MLEEEPEFCYGKIEVGDGNIHCYKMMVGGWRALLQCENYGCNSHRFHISPRYYKSLGFEGEIYLEGWGDSEEEAIADLWEKIYSEGLIPRYGIELHETSASL